MIWRFPLADARDRDVQPLDEVPMPAGAVLLSVALLDSGVWVFAEVDPGAPKAVRLLWVIGTGKEVPAGARFLGTLVLPPFNWHVYDGGEVPLG